MNRVFKVKQKKFSLLQKFSIRHTKQTTKNVADTNFNQTPDSTFRIFRFFLCYKYTQIFCFYLK